MTKIIIATGSGRCGTQTIGTQLGSIKGVYSFHEGISLWPGIRKKCPPAPHLYCADEVDMTDYNERALEYRQNNFLLDQDGYVEAAHYFAPNIDLVENAFPSAKIIHLYRDPVEVVNSYIGHARWDIYHEGKHRRSKDKWKWWGDCFPLNELVKTREEGFAYYWQLTNMAVVNTKLEKLFVPTRELKSKTTWKKILEFAEFDGEIEHPALVYNPLSPKKQRPLTPAVEAAVKKFCTWRP
jgi:hypothetical protein